MVSCGAPGCTNGANKNSNIINSIICNNNVIITISWHIQNSGIFNFVGIFKNPVKYMR